MLIKYIIFGILQGFTEPLPISSSGHIVLVKHFWNNIILSDLNFEIFLNFASFIAILLIYWKDVWCILTGFFQYLIKHDTSFYSDFRTGILIIIGTIPVGLIGILIKKSLEHILLFYPFVVGIGFLVTGVFLFISSFFKGEKDFSSISYLDAFVIGIFQAIALVPGISRSGMTLIGCFARKINRTDSLKYTFLLYLPVSFLTMILGVKDMISNTLATNLLFPYIVSMFFAFLFTYISYHFLKNIVEKGNTWVFSIYLWIIGIISIISLK